MTTTTVPSADAQQQADGTWALRITDADGSMRTEPVPASWPPILAEALAVALTTRMQQEATGP